MAGKAGFFGSAAVLTTAVFLGKILGALYKIPLGNLLGSSGMAHFYAAYNVFNVLLLLSTAGLPVAISRLTSTANAMGRYGQVRRIFRTSLLLLTLIGLVCGGFMFLFPHVLAGLLHDPLAAAGIRILAPSVGCICVMSAIRGYTQGLGDMLPTAVSQIIESAAKLTVGLTACVLLLKRGAAAETAAAGAILGVTAGAVLGLCYLLAALGRHTLPRAADTPLSLRTTAATLLRVGLPITIGSAGMSLITLLDQSLTLYTLQHKLLWSAELAVERYGEYTLSLTLFALPCSFIFPVSAALMPAIAAARAKRDRAGVGELIESALHLTVLLALPMGLGLSVLSAPVLQAFYPAASQAAQAAAVHLQILGLAAVFVCLMAVTSGILQACEREKFPLFSLLCGGLLKLVTNYLMASRPDINVRGAAVSTLFCYALIALLNLLALRRTAGKLPLLRLWWAPVLSSVVMAMAARSLYGLLSPRISLWLTLLLTVSLSAAVYFVLVLALGGVTLGELHDLFPRKSVRE